MITTAYICRHGQTEYNAQGKLQGWFDTPLTKTGLANAHQIARKVQGLNFAAVYSSDLGRAFISAYLICRDIGYQGEIMLEPQLREVSFGDLSGQPEDQVADFYHHLRRAATFVPPHGEALEHMQKRVINFLAQLSAQAPSGPVLLVTHDCVINALYSNFKGLDFGQYNIDHTNPHDFVGRIRITQDGEVLEFEELSKASH